VKFDLPKLGAVLMASAPALTQLGNSKVTWWLAVAFTVVGPFLMTLKCSKKQDK
jgi:hypothetical protein